MISLRRQTCGGQIRKKGKKGRRKKKKKKNHKRREGLGVYVRDCTDDLSHGKTLTQVYTRHARVELHEHSFQFDTYKSSARTSL